MPDAPALADNLARDAKDQIYCKVCCRVLWDCPSCGAWQCGCDVSWKDKLPKRDQKMIGRQHYDKQFVPYSGEPPVDFAALRRDEEDDDDSSEDD